MKKPTDIGMNRTGIDASPIDSKRTLEGAESSTLVPPGDELLIAEERMAWSASADPVGTMPPPGSIKGAVKTTVEMIKGNQPNVFLDKLGERLAYERTGVRLYEALLCKLSAADTHQGGPTREDLVRIRAEELKHFQMLEQAIRQLGGDPTTMTPCADITAVASSGALKVLTDPRSTLTQCLGVMLMIELTDNDAWVMLATMADGLGKDDMAAAFRQALAEEEDHLMHVRAWVNIAVNGQVGIDPTPEQPSA